VPELPEVETIVRGLEREIAGRRLTAAAVHTPSVVRGDARGVEALAGRRASRIERHGKSVFIHFSADDGSAEQTLRVHLGMTGQLLFEAPDVPPARHTHAMFRFEGNPRDLRFRDIRRFGCLEVVTDATRPNLGPDAWLSTPDRIFEALRACSGMAKAVLLNQTVLAGLGNIYVDEALFRSGIHPRAPLGRLPAAKIRALGDAIRLVLAESIELGGTSFRNYVDIEGGRGGFKGRLRVYGKQGSRCRCGDVIRRSVVAGRGTHFCPSCQPVSRRKHRRVRTSARSTRLRRR
jgi:formamidopyrimidine-DNA glycosylase